MASSNNWADTPEVRVLLPNVSNPITLPKGWTRVDPPEPVAVLSPEGDLRCTFLVRTVNESAEEISRAAWQQIDPDFQYPIHAQSEVPSTEGWDGVHGGPHARRSGVCRSN